MRIDCQSHIFPKAYIEVLAQNPHPPQVIRSGSEAVVTYGDVQTFRLQDEAYDPKRKLKDMDAAGSRYGTAQHQYTPTLHACT